MSIMLPLKLNASYYNTKGFVIGFTDDGLLAVFEPANGKPDVVKVSDLVIAHPTAEATTAVPTATKRSARRSRKITKPMAIFLDTLASLDPDRNGISAAKVMEVMAKNSVTIGGDYAKLTLWGLIERVRSSGKGVWRVTAHGANVANGNERIQPNIANGKTYGELVSLSKLIGGTAKVTS